MSLALHHLSCARVVLIHQTRLDLACTSNVRKCKTHVSFEAFSFGLAFKWLLRLFCGARQIEFDHGIHRIVDLCLAFNLHSFSFLDFVFGLASIRLGHHDIVLRGFDKQSVNRVGVFVKFIQALL